MSPGDRVAAAALDLVGTPFRLHGLDPAYGLDCIGLCVSALKQAGLRAQPPRQYRLRNGSITRHLAALGKCDLAETTAPIAPGQIVLVSPGPAQHHLLVASDNERFIHAHAGLRRVVAMPGPLPWPVLRQWRPQPKG